MSRLIVKNLPKAITEDKIRKIFSKKGDITDVQLKFTSDGKFRQFCFIGYKTEEQAKNATNFFNNTCINTNTITVEQCVQLGDSSKPKAWSKYASDSTAYKKKFGNKKDTEENSKDELPQNEKKENNKIKELIEKYKEDPMFEEFMQVHGTQDVNILLTKLEESEKNLKEIEDTVAEDQDEKDDSGHESQDDEKKEKVANKNISDLEYMKLLMSNSMNKKTRKRTEKKPKEIIKLYTVKLRGLPYGCKKANIKKFFHPLVPYTIRLPRNAKGFAYVGFKTEKKMKQALNRDRSFIDGKRIMVFEYVAKDEKSNEEESGNNVRKKKWSSQEESLKNEEDIAESGKIFLRNLAYTTSENEVQELFSKYGPVTEINLPIDKDTRKLKGFGIITFLMPEHASKAYSELDGSIFQGRMLHLLPAKIKQTSDDLENSNLSYKEKKALKDKAEAGSSHNWNSLFMGHDAVAEVIADTYGTTKEQVLDGKGSAAVRLALGETQIVAQTKQFLEERGVCLNAFNQTGGKRSTTTILAKNLPAQTKPQEIESLFKKYGLLGRVVLPPSGVTALVEFLEPSEARKAFTKIAYSKFKDQPIYLEWAPENSFTKSIPVENKKPETKKSDNVELEKPNKDVDEKNDQESNKHEENNDNDDDDEDDEPEPDTTIFVKNLNFKTTEESLRKHFAPFGKLNYVSVATKKDPKNPGKILSLGYGFVRYQYKAGANKALKELQQSTLDGKGLELKRSERTLSNETRPQKKIVKTLKQTGTKILIRNVPFQANQSEIEELFKAFGELSAVRLPKKLTAGPEQHRGFAFVDFVTKSDAKRAFEALSQSTHLYGRRLVLEWATANEDVDDIRKRTAKHFHNTADDKQNKTKKSRLDVDTFVNQ